MQVCIYMMAILKPLGPYLRSVYYIDLLELLLHDLEYVTDLILSHATRQCDITQRIKQSLILSSGGTMIHLTNDGTSEFILRPELSLEHSRDVRQTAC